MKKYSLLLTLLLLAGQAMADWTPYEQDETSTSYLDRQSIVRTGSIVKVWFLFDNKTPQSLDGAGKILGHSSTVSLFEFDCENNKFHVLQGAAYEGKMGQGAVKFSSNSPTPWEYVVPNSFQDKRLKLVCEKRPNKP